MAICTELIPAMETNNIHNITVITDSITAVRKILESKVNPLQNIFIPLASTIKSFFSKDCYNLAKWLSHYLYFFSFSFFLSWIYYTEGSAGKCHITSVTQGVTMSHDRHGKIVHRPCSNCISSVENLIGTLSSSFCQSLNKEQLALFWLGVQLSYKDGRNKIHFWYCPSKAEWPRHKLVNDQVKANAYISIFPSKDSHLFSKKKECNNILYKWQTLFTNSLKKGYYFLNFEDEKQKVIKPTYAKGSLWLLVIGFTNSLCVRFTHMTTGHAPIGEYRQRFFPHLSTSYLCGKAEIQTCEHIVSQTSFSHISTKSSTIPTVSKPA